MEAEPSLDAAAEAEPSLNAKAEPSADAVDAAAARASLESKIEEFRDSLPFVERLDITATTPLALESAQDDLKREVAFYNQTLENVVAARALLDEEGVPYKRPADYLAEMLKTDEHMQKVRNQLVFEERRMASFEERRKQKEQKKFARAVQAQRVKEKSAERKEAIHEVAAWRKSRKRKLAEGDDGGDELPVSLGGRPDSQPAKRAKGRGGSFGAPKRPAGRKVPRKPGQRPPKSDKRRLGKSKRAAVAGRRGKAKK